MQNVSHVHMPNLTPQEPGLLPCHSAMCDILICVLAGPPAVLKTIMEVFFETYTPATILQVRGATVWWVLCTGLSCLKPAAQQFLLRPV
jgi:hypothetical protein